MSSSVEEVRKSARKEILLPSGLEIEIRKIRVEGFLNLGPIPYPSSHAPEEKPQPVTTALVTEGNRYYSRAIVLGATVLARVIDLYCSRSLSDRTSVNDTLTSRGTNGRGSDVARKLIGEVLWFSQPVFTTADGSLGVGRTAWR